VAVAVLFVPRLTPSLNTWQRVHWRQRTRDRRTFGWELAAVRPKAWPDPPPVCVHVALVRCGGKLLDRDNLYGGVKVLVDALKDARLIRDDTDEAIRLEVSQDPQARPRGMLVRLEAVEARP
jgi:hypothetical protein